MAKGCVYIPKTGKDAGKVFGSKESLAAHMNYTPALTDLMSKFQQSGGKADIDSVTKWLTDNGYLKAEAVKPAAPQVEKGRKEVYNQQYNDLVSGKVLDNEGDPVYEEDKGIGANGLATLTDKKYGHGHTRTSGLNSLEVLENLLDGGNFSGMFGKIGQGDYSTWESGKFVIVSNSINPTKNGKLKLNEVEIILNAGLTPFAQELANKYPNVTFKDFNGKKYSAELVTPQVEEAAPAKKEKAPETKPEVKTEPKTTRKKRIAKIFEGEEEAEPAAVETKTEERKPRESRLFETEENEKFVSDRIEEVNKNGKPLSEFKVGDIVVRAIDERMGWVSYIEGVVLGPDETENIVIERLPGNIDSEEWPESYVGNNSLVILKPEGEPAYAGEANFRRTELTEGKKAPETKPEPKTKKEPETKPKPKTKKEPATTPKAGKKPKYEIKVENGIPEKDGFLRKQIILKDGKVIKEIVKKDFKGKDDTFEQAMNWLEKEVGPIDYQKPFELFSKMFEYYDQFFEENPDADTLVGDGYEYAANKMVEEQGISRELADYLENKIQYMGPGYAESLQDFQKYPSKVRLALDIDEIISREENITPKRTGKARIAKMFQTEGENAAEEVQNFLEETGINIEIIDDEQAKKLGQERNIEGSAQGRFMIDKDKGTIYINRDALSRSGKTLVYHEGIHPVINIIRNTNPELYRKIINGLKAEAKRNPEIARAIRQVEAVEEYQKRGSETIEDESIVEVSARLASGEIDIDKIDKSLKDKLIDLWNRIAKALGIPTINTNPTSQEFRDFIQKLSKALNEGGKISDIVGKENVKAFASPKYVDSQGNEITAQDVKYSLIDRFTDPKSGFTFEYLADNEEFEELKKNGQITEDRTLDDFVDKYIYGHSPDAAFTGNIKKKDEDGKEITIVEGKGGVFYPIKFIKEFFVWASTASAANSMAKQLNENAKKNEGPIYLALVSAPEDKLLSSTTSSNGVIDIFKAMSNDFSGFGIPKNVFKNALLKAAKATQVNAQGKKVGLNLKTLTQANTVEEIESAVRKSLAADASIFDDRKTFSLAFIRAFSDGISGTKSEQKVGKFLVQGVEVKGYKQQGKIGEPGKEKYKLSAKNMVSAISQMMGEPMLRGESSKKIYAIIEVTPNPKGVASPSVQPIDSSLHESYPKAIKLAGEGMKVKVHILQDRELWTDRLADPETGELVATDREKKVFPTSGVTTTSLKVLPKKPTAPATGKVTEQLSTGIERTNDQIRQLMEDAMDAIDEAIASGTDAQIAVNDFVGSQDWYNELNPKYKNQFDEFIKEDFGVTPRGLPKKPAPKTAPKAPKAPKAAPTSGLAANISSIVENYYKIKDGDRAERAAARDAIDEILDLDPKLKYIYKNISDINKQLQEAGVITDKTDGCP
jgi:hypothetical protein